MARPNAALSDGAHVVIIGAGIVGRALAYHLAFHRYGAALDSKCVIVRDLPDYPISRIETGQWLPGEGELRSARVAVDD